MADTRFFHRSSPLSVSELAALTGAIPTFPVGAIDSSQAFTDIAPLDQAGASAISFLDNVKYLDAFAKSKAGACFVREKYASRAPSGMLLLITPEPYYAYAVTAQRLYPTHAPEPGISPKATIAPGAMIDEGCRIDPGAVIGDKVTLGAGCHIGANCVIHEGVEIGEQSRIGANVTISHAIIGKRAIIHPGVQIGQDGFGFAPSPIGIAKVPQLGRVLIGNDVEIGANSCIDRGAGPDTIIGDHSKIDNLVQIGHNVELGKYVIITGQCGISGSTHIGDGVMLGAQSGLAGHLKIGAGAKLAARSGVMTDIPPGATYGGTPAQPVRNWHRQTVALAKLTEKN